MEEKPSTYTGDVDSSLEVSYSANVAEGSDFCLLSEDDIEMEDSDDGGSLQSRHSVQDTPEVPKDTVQQQTTFSVDVETMKRKAEEIANSLRKFRSNRTSDVNVPSENYEPPEELKHYRERSVFVAQKLKEDRLLFEESKKRNEAVVDKVRNVRQIHKSISESAKELRRDDPTCDETMTLRLKIERLEALLSHLQNTLASKNQIIFENKETIRTLNESVESARETYLNYVEQSEEEIQQLREEHVKALEKIANSRDEFCNQLQTVRKKYLLMENDLKLSEFARFRLVTRNAELRERVCQLENELKIPHTKSMSMEDFGDTKSEISVDNQTVAVSDLHPKVEYLATITDEFYSYIMSDTEKSDDPLLVDEDCDPLQSMEKIGDRLKSAFYVVRGKLSDFSELENHAKQMKEKFSQLEEIIQENKNQDAKQKKIFATMKAKIQSETNINKDLTEQLSKAQKHIKLIEESTGEEWFTKCQELEKANQHLQYELSNLQNNLSASESASELHELIDQLKRELTAKILECEELRRTCEQLEDSNDKLENDFVVLQKRDCDDEENWRRTCAQLKDENAKLLENTRSMVEKATEYENERLSLYRQIDELRRAIRELTEQLETVNKQSFAFHDAKIEHDNEMQVEIENLTAECSALRREVEEFKKQLMYESSSNRDLREQMQFAENTNATLSHEIHDLQKRNQELESQIMTLEEGIDELKERLNNVESEKTSLQQYKVRSDEALSECEDECKKREMELEHVRSYCASLQAEIEKLGGEKEAIIEEREQLEMKIIDNEVNVEALRRANEELTASVRQLRQSISEIEDEKEQLTIQYEAQFARDACSFQELENLRSQIERLNSENQQLENLKLQIEMLENEKRELLDRYEQYRSRVRILEAENENSSNEGSSELRERITVLEAEKRQLADECDKFKSKYQRLQVYCKANISKANANEGSSMDTEKWKAAYAKAQDELTKTQEREAHLKKALELQQSDDALKVEVETWKCEYEKINNALNVAQLEISSLKQLVSEYEAEFRKAQDSLAQQGTQAMTSNDNQLLDVESAVEVVVNECMRQTDEDVQKAVDQVVNECILQTDDLRNSINELKEENHRLREQYKEMERCQLRVSQLQEELHSVRLDYNNLEQRLYNMDEESGIEISKYQELLTEARSDLNSTETYLAEANRLLEQKDSDFREYRHQMEEFVQSNRSMYEQRLAELASNNTKNDTVDATVQTETETERVSGTGENQPATISKYFDYYKDKFTKEITNVLQPEERSTDYSNWILPERKDVEFQAMYQQVPEFSYESRERNPSSDKSSQTQVNTQNQASQVAILSLHQAEQNSEEDESQTHERLSLSQVISQLLELIIKKTDGDEWAVNDADWLSDELDVYNENFVNTSLKFIDLFNAVIRYYSTVPQGDILLEKFQNILGVSRPDHETSPSQWNHRDSYNQLVTLCTHLECENKYLVEAVTFVEDSVLARLPVEIIRFQDTLLSWRRDIPIEEIDIIDRICEEYDIIPNKFTAGASFVAWKETMLKLVETSICTVTKTSELESVSCSVAESLVTVMKKNHKLIGDLYYKYGVDKAFDPNEFFDQINDINDDVERLVKCVKGEISEMEPEKIRDDLDQSHGHHAHHDHEPHHDHDPHHDHENDHQHRHETHHHPDQTEHKSKTDDSNAVTELKQLLAESNKKIDSLVRELMEVKNSKDYNEMKQLHAKLDETLYQLHLRDVHNAELTQELTQLLSERDALQLKLSSIIRQYEELRQAFESANQSHDGGVQLSDVSEKLEQLHEVNYMKDPRISEASKQYHATGMQLFNDDLSETVHRAREETGSGFSVPSLFKWITGDTDNK